MDDLALVGVHDDGDHLLLTAPDGRRYRLRVDEALRAAVRRDRARLGQLQNELDGRMRPKEIQARIRAGESAEKVAEAAGAPVEHVRRYEGPVLAERAFIAAQAREVRIRRAVSAGSGDAQALGAVVAERLAQRDVDPEQVGWDAWRHDDGSWVVQLEFTAGSRTRQARWTYDGSVRHVAALDDEARWLTEDEPATAPITAPQRRLTPVRELRHELGYEMGYEVESTPVPRTAPEDPPSIDLLDTLRERRGRRNRPADTEPGGIDPVREAIDSLLSKAESLGDPPAAHPTRSRPQDARDGEVLVLPDADPITGREVGVGAPKARSRATSRTVDGGPGRLADRTPPATPAAELEDDDPLAASGEPRRSAGRKPRRASVPSWDDIVFGQRRD